MQHKSYDLKKINDRFSEVAELLKAGSRSKLANNIGVGGSLSEYFKAEQNRKVSTIADKLYAFYGINQDWFLNGFGPKRVQDIRERDEESKQFEELGRIAYALIKKAEEIGTFKQENDSTADCRLPTAAPETVSDEPFTLPTPPARQQAGPPPSIEAFERSQEGMRSPIRRS